MPDLTILFDLEPKVGLARIHSHNDREVNRLDVESLSFHEKVREGYQLLVKRYPNRIKVVNADQPIDKVVEDVWHLLSETLEESNEVGILCML